MSGEQERDPRPTRLGGLGLAAGLASALALTSCGGSPQVTPSEAPSASAAAETRSARPDGVSAMAEVGALNENAAKDSFMASLDGLQACIEDGARRLPIVGGSIEFSVKVDQHGRPSRVWASQSSLGERRTEKCMFDALRQVDWPIPTGGLYGLARSSFEFDRRRGVKPPGVWDAGRVIPVLQSVSEAISRCRSGNAGKLLVTLYIGENGQALSGGAASDDSIDEAAVDCVVDTLLAADYPPPERAPTQVRFRL